jgi:hypothetical protein
VNVFGEILVNVCVNGVKKEAPVLIVREKGPNLRDLCVRRDFTEEIYKTALKALDWLFEIFGTDWSTMSLFGGGSV